MLFVQLLVNGLQLGALYALIAAGFSLVFGTTRIFHVAHGATFTLAGFIFYELTVVLGWHQALASVLAAGAAVVFGVLLNRWVYALIQRNEGAFFTLFVASFGAALVLQNVVAIVFGRGLVSVTSSLSRSVEVLPGLYVAPVFGLIVVVAVLAFWLLNLLLTKTNIGLALRALGQNPELVRVYGMIPRGLSQWAFVIGSLLVVPAAIFTAMTTGLNPIVGNHVMLISIAATIVGGVGSLKGAALAGLLLGMAESLSLLWVTPQWSEAVTFVVLFLFILFRPAGVFGRVAVS